MLLVTFDILPFFSISLIICFLLIVRLSSFSSYLKSGVSNKIRECEVNVNQMKDWRAGFSTSIRNTPEIVHKIITSLATKISLQIGLKLFEKFVIVWIEMFEEHGFWLLCNHVMKNKTEFMHLKSRIAVLTLISLIDFQLFIVLS